MTSEGMGFLTVDMKMARMIMSFCHNGGELNILIICMG